MIVPRKKRKGNEKRGRIEKKGGAVLKEKKGVRRFLPGGQRPAAAIACALIDEKEYT